MIHPFSLGGCILTVTDPQGATSTLSKVVSLNNTPPVVQITSPIDGSFYSMNEPTLIELGATVYDAEHGPADLVYEWMEVLHHNTHTHEEPPIFEETPTFDVCRGANRVLIRCLYVATNRLNS